jgi:MOSC domain-containing protein YiiM
MNTGTIHQINISPGGVPKTPVESAIVRVGGIEGDGQDHPKSHGGPERAVCLYGLEVIQHVASEGHPIAPGTTGENVTIIGLDWERVTPGCRLAFEGGVELEVASYCAPCWIIADSFTGGEFKRIGQEQSPGQSRVYARVLKEGTIRTGERVELLTD